MGVFCKVEMGDEFTYEQHLWDGMKAVTDRFAEGKKTLNEVVKFLDSRGSIEGDCSKKLISAVPKPSTTAEAGSLGFGWLAFRNYTDEQAKARSILADVFRRNAAELSTFKKEITRQRDAHVATVSNLTRDLEKGRSSVKRAMTLYHQKTESAENALMAYEKAQQDPTFTHKNLAKLNSSATKLRKDAENADNAYQATLQEFQQFQVKYEEGMKEILREFQAIEERRVGKLKDVMDMIVTAQQTLLADLVKFEEAFKDAAVKINGLEDIQNFISVNKTGLQPPKPTEYEPYKGKHEQFKKKSIPVAVAVTTRTEPAATTTAAQPATRGPEKIARNPTAPSVKAKALYEYNAADATELSFAVGDIINVTKQDASGWWEGENKGKHGMFPGNYVELIAGGAAAAAGDGKKRCVAKFEFVASSADELTIRVGETITIDTEASGWYAGTNSAGESGLFPANYVELC